MAGLGDLRLDGRVALVTRAGGAGTGRAIAWRLAGAGAQLVVGGLDEAGVRETAALYEQAGPASPALRVDVTDEASAGAACAAAVERFGRVDIPVNNAGINESTPAWEIDVPAFDRMLERLRGTWRPAVSKSSHWRK